MPVVVAAWLFTSTQPPLDPQANALLVAYSVLFLTTFKLLHCVKVPGLGPANGRLFLDGSVHCDYAGWQLPLLFGLLLMFAVPFAVVYATWRLYAKRNATHTKAALYRVMSGAYRDDTSGNRLFWWEAVLMWHRIAVFLLQTFVPAAIIKQTGTLLVNTAFLILHLIKHPMRYEHVQRLQSVLLACLVVLTAATIPSAVKEELAPPSSASSISHASSTFLAIVLLCFAYVIPIAAVAVTYVLTHMEVFKRLCLRRHKDGGARVLKSKAGHWVLDRQGSVNSDVTSRWYQRRSRRGPLLRRRSVLSPSPLSAAHDPLAATQPLLRGTGL